jgi:hypothetical protein
MDSLNDFIFIIKNLNIYHLSYNLFLNQLIFKALIAISIAIVIASAITIC